MDTQDGAAWSTTSRRRAGDLPATGKAVLVLIAMLSASVTFIQPVQAESRMWVAADNAKRRSCPSMECGIIGRLFFRETVVVYETSKGWSRVSGYSNAGCYEEQSSFVQAGRNDCSEENGISDGEFAIWVKSDSLADQKPGRIPEVQGSDETI
ncbi:hypothetical protein ACX3P1_15685 [Mesorhizobium sp. A623]